MTVRNHFHIANLTFKAKMCKSNELFRARKVAALLFFYNFSSFTSWYPSSLRQSIFFPLLWDTSISPPHHCHQKRHYCRPHPSPDLEYANQLCASFLYQRWDKCGEDIAGGDPIVRSLFRKAFCSNSSKVWPGGLTKLLIRHWCLLQVCHKPN